MAYENSVTFDWICRDKDGLHLFSGEPDWSDDGQYWCIGPGPATDCIDIYALHLDSRNIAVMIPMNHKRQIEPIMFALRPVGAEISCHDGPFACDD